MPKFVVILRRDAWVNYTATTEADDATEACGIAEHAWKWGDETIKFDEDGLTEFDEILCDPDDAEEVGEDQNPAQEDTSAAVNPETDWRYEVANGGTRLGFVEWLAHKREAETT